MTTTVLKANDLQHEVTELKSIAPQQEPTYITYDVRLSDDPAIIGADIASTIDLLLKDMAANPRPAVLTVNFHKVQ